ncbi:MAG: ABC-ATPase domain-containing protein, partial [Desulfurococcales archaeon]|nr:ABC-ATPase domain-containing protein [Desulfurococcales archaeon]
VTGMGVRRGVTIIAGSAFHGKTTLLEAIAAGVWNHVPGDGRERVVTIRDAMYVRAEDGRYISCVDIEPFVHDLPGGRSTKCFSTSDASGATSVAASIQEAVEAGARLLLFDEDTSATNMLYLDERVKPLTRRHTVTPLSELAKDMKEKGLSIVIVSTGSLPLIAVADTVIVMEDYRPRDASRDAEKLARSISTNTHSGYRYPEERVVEQAEPLVKPRVRAGMLVARNLESPLPLLNNIHLVEETQLNTLAALAARAREWTGRLIRELARGYEEKTRKDPGVLGESPALGEVRGLDVAFLVNRLPVIRAKQVGG